MNQSFYIAALGAQQQQRHLNVQGNNIANVNTYGFKGQKARFSSLMFTSMPTAEGTDTSGTGGTLLSTDTNHTIGSAMHTGRMHDYMIQGSGFFALVDLATGQVSLTRNGAFCMAEMLRNSGQVDENGQPIMESRYCLSDGSGRFVLGSDGDLIEMDAESDHLDVGVFDYVNYNGMEHLNDTRFLAVDKNGGIMLGEGTVVSRMLESSNVDLAEEMTKIIEAQRLYSLSLRMVTTSDEVESTINGLRN